MKSSKKAAGTALLKVAGYEIEVVRRLQKNLYIRILPPDGRICVSAPKGCSLKRVEEAVRKRLPWIRKGLVRLKEHPPAHVPKITDGALIPFMGCSYPLRISSEQGRKSAKVELNDGQILMTVPSGLDQQALRQILGQWHRHMMRQTLPKMISSWQEKMGVQVAEFRIRKMKTRWGSCNTAARRIWLNLELSLKRVELMEYVLVHEMIHLMEPSHNSRFKALMDRFLPGWPRLKEELDRTPPGYFL